MLAVLPQPQEQQQGVTREMIEEIAQMVPCQLAPVMGPDWAPGGLYVPVMQVAYNGGQWWDMPMELSLPLFHAKMQGLPNQIYCWDWGGNGHLGTFELNGRQTGWSRYNLQFDTMIQTNLDTQGQRSVRIVYVRHEDLEATHTGGGRKRQ